MLLMVVKSLIFMHVAAPSAANEAPPPPSGSGDDVAAHGSHNSLPSTPAMVRSPSAEGDDMDEDGDYHDERMDEDSYDDERSELDHEQHDMHGSASVEPLQPHRDATATATALNGCCSTHSKAAAQRFAPAQCCSSVVACLPCSASAACTWTCAAWTYAAWICTAWTCAARPHNAIRLGA